MTTNIRVVPPGLHKGAILVALALGPIVGGVLYIQVELLIEHVYSMRLPAWTRFAAFASVFSVLSVPFLWIVLLDATSQRRWTMAGASAVGYFSLVLTVALTAVLNAFTGDLLMRWIDLLYASAWIGGVMIAAALAALLLRFLTRWLIVRAVEQTGTLCWTCAYDLSATAPGNPCPECGTSPATNRPRRRALIRTVLFCNRHALKVLVLITLVAASFIGWQLTTKVYPLMKLHRVLGSPPGSTMPVVYYDQRRGRSEHRLRFKVPIPDVGPEYVELEYCLRCDPAQVPMTLAVLEFTNPVPGYSIVTYPPPALRISLTPQQALHVRHNGVPPALIVAMHRAWLNARSEYNELRSQNASTSHLESKYAIDPAPFFPPSPR